MYRCLPFYKIRYYIDEVRTRKSTISKRWKKEYYKMVDGIVRSHAVQKFFIRTIYLFCFIATIILVTLLYLNS